MLFGVVDDFPWQTIGFTLLSQIDVEVVCEALYDFIGQCGPIDFHAGLNHEIEDSGALTFDGRIHELQVAHVHLYIGVQLRLTLTIGSFAGIVSVTASDIYQSAWCQGGEEVLASVSFGKDDLNDLTGTLVSSSDWIVLGPFGCVFTEHGESDEGNSDGLSIPLFVVPCHFGLHALVADNSC